MRNTKETLVAGGAVLMLLLGGCATEPEADLDASGDLDDSADSGQRYYGMDYLEGEADQLCFKPSIDGFHHFMIHRGKAGYDYKPAAAGDQFRIDFDRKAGAIGEDFMLRFRPLDEERNETMAEGETWAEVTSWETINDGATETGSVIVYVRDTAIYEMVVTTRTNEANAGAEKPPISSGCYAASAQVDVSDVDGRVMLENPGAAE